MEVECGYIADKFVGRVLPEHKALLLPYLCLSNYLVSLPIDFTSVSLTEGIQRCAL